MSDPRLVNPKYTRDPVPSNVYDVLVDGVPHQCAHINEVAGVWYVQIGLYAGDAHRKQYVLTTLCAPKERAVIKLVLEDEQFTVHGLSASENPAGQIVLEFSRVDEAK